jgi:hypothetical protein
MNMGVEESRIAELVERGATLSEVEDDVISDAPLDGDGKDGLWLFAWSFSRRTWPLESGRG